MAMTLYKKGKDGVEECTCGESQYKHWLENGWTLNKSDVDGTKEKAKDESTPNKASK